MIAADEAGRALSADRSGRGRLIGVVHRADSATRREVAMKITPRPRGGTNLRDEFVARPGCATPTWCRCSTTA